jgi:ferredoxin
MKATVDKDLCAGCAVCVAVCPEVFEMKDGKAEIKVCPIPPEAETRCREAADHCPPEAIKIEET